MSDRDEKGRFALGNPGGPGRPKFSVVARLREKLEEVPPGEEKARIDELIDLYLAEIMENRDGVAIRDLIDRFDGKPTQSHQVEGQIGHKVSFARDAD